jgi:hypothetical protein
LTRRRKGPVGDKVKFGMRGAVTIWCNVVANIFDAVD